MSVIRTSTGTAQEIATENGPMTTAAGSKQSGSAPATYADAVPITGADTSRVNRADGQQEVYSAPVVP